MRFVVYRDIGGEWRWTLRAYNNKTVADSAEGYRTKHGCRMAVRRVKRGIAKAKTVEGPTGG